MRKLLKTLLKDRLLRRFVSTALFAGAFVWVAVAFFDVDTEVIWVLLVFSCGFVLLLILTGLVFAPLLALFNRRPPMLSRLSKVKQKKVEQKKVEQATDDGDKCDQQSPP